LRLCAFSAPLIQPLEVSYPWFEWFHVGVEKLVIKKAAWLELRFSLFFSVTTGCL
jgi:hypothetical protein